MDLDIKGINNKKRQNIIATNTSMLVMLNIAKLVFPFFTLPYLTRVLSTDCYGIVAYEKAIMNYMQVVIDFGFALSATKQVVQYKEDKSKLDYIVSTNIIAKVMLATIACLVLTALIVMIPILRVNVLYTYLSFTSVFMTIFLLDFLFRGLEKMHIITIRFVIMKGIATLLTFIFVKKNSDILLIPILELIGSIVAAIWIYLEVRKVGIRYVHPKIKDCLATISESAVYFLSNVASTTFNVLNTVVAGIVLTSADVAYWSVCIQIISAGQALYSPISDAIYPEMVRSKDACLLKKIITTFTPLIILGCLLCVLWGKYALLIVGGEKYLGAISIFRDLIPVLFLGFYAIILGWPALGSINRIKETTKSTVTAAIIQILFTGIAVLIGKYTLLFMAIIRCMGEVVMFSMRFYYFKKYRNEFNN
ncbi:oligosaccharide flippase family protein [Oribacterium sp. WCC10]|uniref:oligosaccharide flippase family protein n=1 Tax=Oribacterium sp. WCC10 TaxID=1855343 RepID=UPI0008E67144|nr:oligosaccharide flippase family protein [Oribacterium sp. WCC10]SFG64071.1 polysaccharide transporter, PST family [Oribacterium sp. WCC10]